MEQLIIEGPAKLSGTVEVSGSKNTALPLLFASILFDQEVKYTNVPRLWDVETTLFLLKHMGAESSWDKEKGEISIFPKIKDPTAPYEWVKKMRAGILALGPLVAKCGEARVSLPGGCAIGARPVDYHLEALRKMGVTVNVEEGYVHAKVQNKIHGAHLVFPQVTVTGTENILYVAAVADGKTVIENAAREPEVVATGELLIRCGAKITGLGTPTIEVVGAKLHAPKDPIEIPADRIEGGTWVAAAVATRSELTITKTDAAQMGATLECFREMGAGIHVSDDGKTIKVAPRDIYTPIKVETQPFPGFATDMQAQMIVAMLQANGTSSMNETIFENRFMHVAELRRLGAQISIHGTLAMVEGGHKLEGAPLMATDLRASASLVLAGLCAHGKTSVSRLYHLDRGYQRLDEKLRQLGARIFRVPE